MISRDPKKRIQYEGRLKAQLDENHLRNHSRREGRAEGQITFLEQLLQLPETPAEELESWSLEQLTARVEELKKQWGRGAS